jgi:membrane-associated protein
MVNKTDVGPLAQGALTHLNSPTVAVVGGIVGDNVQKILERASGPWLYVIAFVMTFAETGTLLFFIPGEITLLFVGAAAGAGDLNVVALVVIGIVAAILGDFTGFQIGRRYGVRVKASWLGRRIGAESWAKSDDLIRRRKGLVVLVGRWVGFLRAVMPASAGMSGMAYREFLPYDVVGAVTWAGGCVIAGYLVGDNFAKLETWLGRGGTAVGVALVVGLVARHFIKKRRGAKNKVAA